MNTRREFLQASTLFFAPALLAGGMAANDRIRVGIAGVKGRGFALLRSLLELGKAHNVEVAALCDVDSEVLSQRAATCEKLNGGKRVAAVSDLRRMIEDKSLDAIVHATPTNWHALGAIWTMQAGKDAYVEKPLALTLWEGHKIVEAARNYGRIVQHGTQCRSSPEILEAMTLVREGAIGQVYLVRGIGHKYRPSIGPLKPETPPATLNYDLWRGPAPLKPYSANQVHYNWHWFWDTGNGDIGNNGVHAMDATRWLIPNATLPQAVISVGGRFVWNDQGQTPNLQFAVFDFGPTKMIFEVTEFKTEGGRQDRVFDTKGTAAPIEIVTPADVKAPTAARGPGGSIFENFIACVRSRRSQDQDAHILEGHYSAALCHLANISYRLGQDTSFAARPAELGDHEEVRKTFDWFRELLLGLDVKLDRATYRLGRPLKFDPAREKFVGDAEADKLLTREYRPPFVVPEKV